MANFSDSDNSLASSITNRCRNVALHDRCTMPDMNLMKGKFEEANNNKMTATEFRNLLSTLNIEYDDDEYKILFLKMNTSRTGELDWDEVVSHLILGYFANDTENQRESLQPPILGRPLVLSSHHTHLISRIRFCPDVAKDRSIDAMQGSYITAGRDGVLNWWSLDMKLLRTARSTSPHLKIHTTWVTDMVCMPDVNIIVTSSTERDLRFYDCTARTFILKLIISGWEYMICTMSYYFNKEDADQCKLICGDVGGNVRVLRFSAYLRGPFGGDSGRTLQKLQHFDLQKRPCMQPGLRLTELMRAHPEWVRQVSYYESLQCVVSCANCPDALLMCDLQGSKDHHSIFRVEKGIQCFAFDEDAHVLVTGGPDCVVRVWNPFVPAEANVTLHGHHSGVTCIVLQDKGQTIYSLSRDRTIKVWDVHSQTCLQTYTDIPGVLDDKMPLSAVYNPGTRQFIMATIKIAIVVLDEQLNPLHTDGFTHSRAVSKVLYNPLFKVIVTCGMDSIIITWDPVTGKRNVMIRDAHVRIVHSTQVPAEITAACFDPGFLLLLTGARTGELKVWNFNTGVCLRVMSIEHMCKVSSCFWVEGRILAVGWNKHVVEFEDPAMATTGKSWETRHTDDVMAAAVRPPHSVATASHNSELVLWRLETGQAYREFLCTEPDQHINIKYKRDALKSPSALGSKGSSGKMPAMLSAIRKPSTAAADIVDPKAAIKKAVVRSLPPTRPSILPFESYMHRLSVPAMISLNTRPLHESVASLLLALEDGRVQCWSDHSAGGCQGSFDAVHKAGDYVSSFATDDDNEFLFTGTALGYVKVWLLSNFLINDHVHVNMPRLRLLFPFLWRDRIEGRAKRTTRDQPLPLLLNSYRAHMRCVTTITYVDELKLVFTGSSDYSARVWRLSGEYLQTLGSFLPWSLEVTRFPPDVQKVASSTTLKVWRGGSVSRYVPGQKEVDRLRDITEHELEHSTFGKPPREPLLGQYSSLPRPSEPQDSIRFNLSLPTIPVYAHARLASTQPVRRPPTPELLRQIRTRERPKKMHFDMHVPPARQRRARCTPNCNCNTTTACSAGCLLRNGRSTIHFATADSGALR